MEHNNCKFPVQHSYIKVENNRSISHGSVGSPDDLSYSYSCINAFRKNQSIIKNLTSLHVNKNFQGEGHEPLLYSLSGDREKPICGPFYYSSSSGGAKNNYYSTEKLIKIEDPSSSCLESEYENIFSDKSALFDWLKDQVKYVNVLWSFSKSSYINLSKFCKCKNQDIKMEMLLNNIDENTKTRLKRYLNELNLDLEERCTLFNESTIEIDITPILADKSKFQAFLSFLKTIDNGVYNSVEGNKTQPFNQLPERTQNKITNKYISPTKEIKQGERATRRDRQLRTCSEDRTNQQISRFPENNDEQLSKGCIVKPKHTEIYGPKLTHNYKETSQNIKVRSHSPSYFPHENSLKAPSGSGNIKHRSINNNQSISKKDKLSRKPRARFESTLAKQRSLNCLVDRKQTSRILDDPTPSAEEQSNVSDTNRAQTDRKLSCKCLIHLRREDYYRYRNQCLFGKGDETSNNFVKYLTDKEREAECQVHKCRQNAEKGCRKTLDTKHIKDEPFDELGEDECCYTFRKNQKLKYEYKNENLKRAVVEDNKLKRAAEKDCTRKSSQNNYYKTDETIRVGDVERLMYSINYNDRNYNYEYGCFYNNLGIYRSKPNRMTVAEEEPSSLNACFESLSYDVAKLRRSANSTCEKSKSDTGINGKFAPVEYGQMNSEIEPMEKMNKKVNKDHWYRCHSIKPSGDQDLLTKRNFDLKNDKNPSVQVLHCNKRLQNYVDTKFCPHNYTSDEFIMFNDGIKQSSYKKLPINEKNVKTKKRKSLQSLGSSHRYESITNANKCSLLTNYSRIGLLDKMSVVIKTNRSNDGARPQLKEMKSHRTHLSLNSLRPKNLYRNISTVLKQKSSTNKSKSQQTKINVSENVPSFSEEKFKCKIKETKPTRNLNLRQKNSCGSVFERELPSSDSSEAKPEFNSMLTELLDRLITELQNQRIEINEMKKSLNDQKDRSDA